MNNYKLISFFILLIFLSCGHAASVVAYEDFQDGVIGEDLSKGSWYAVRGDIEDLRYTQARMDDYAISARPVGNIIRARKDFTNTIADTDEDIYAKFTVTTGTLELMFGIWGQVHPGFYIYIREGRDIIFHPANGANRVIADSYQITANTTYEFIVQIKSSAFDGSGKGSVKVRNLSAGDNEYTPIEGLQDIDMNFMDKEEFTKPSNFASFYVGGRFNGWFDYMEIGTGDISKAVIKSSADIKNIIAIGTVSLSQSNQLLPDVMVSDGVNIVLTDQEGNYELPLSQDARFVMVVTPPQAQPNRVFYSPVSKESTETITIDFELPEAEYSPNEPFSFAKIADSHAVSLGGAMRIAEPIFNSVNALPKRPLFMIEAGDLSCHVGDGEIPMQTYGKHLDIPYFPVTGNHDWSRSRNMPFAGYEFESVFGPWYYAFYCGNYLFVGLPWSHLDNTLDQCADWLENLLRINSETKEAYVMPFFHYWDGFGSFGTEQQTRFVDILRKFETRAAFIGHWHMSRVNSTYGIPNYMIRTPSMGNRDLAPGGYMLITAYPDGQLEADFRVARYEQYVSVAWPPNNGEIANNSQPLVINAYDTTYNVSNVSASVYDTENNNLLQKIELTDSGGWTWIGQILPDRNWLAEVKLVINVTDELGRRWVTDHTYFKTSDMPKISLSKGEDWQMVNYNQKRTGASPQSLSPPLNLAWAHTTGKSFGQTSPIIIDGVLYAAVENNYEPIEPVPSIIALDALSGNQLWSYPLAGKSVRGTLAGNSDLICALADDGTVFALDPASGELLWQQSNMVSEPQWKELYNSSPVLTENKLFAGIGSAFSAYDITDGNLIWQTSIVREGGRRWTQDPSPAIFDDNVVLAWDSLHTFSQSDGEQIWEYEHDFMITFTPTVSDNKVLTITLAPDEGRSSQTRLLKAIDVENGEMLWSYPICRGRQRGIYNSPVIADDVVYTIDSEYLHAVDLNDGSGLWKVELSNADYVTGSAVLAGDHLYYVHSCGLIVAVDIKQKQIVWSHSLGVRVDSSIAVSGNILYIAARDGTIYAFAGLM